MILHPYNRDHLNIISVIYISVILLSVTLELVLLCAFTGDSVLSSVQWNASDVPVNQSKITMSVKKMVGLSL